MQSPVIRPLESEADAEAFLDLNRRWIEHYFEMTDEDERVLSHPRESIVEPGGEVLMAVDGEGAVIGVIAILAAGPGTFELAKMTVASSARGLGIGRLLVDAAVEWASSRHAATLFLGTNSRLRPAIRVYEAAGFRRVTREELSLGNYYARADTLMAIEIPGSDLAGGHASLIDDRD